MWSVGSDVFDIYIGEALVGIHQRGVAKDPENRWLPCDSPVQGWLDVAETLSDGPSPLRRVGAYVWISGSLARPFLFGPIVGLKHRKEAEDVAVSLAPEATGLSGPCSVWLDNWSVDRPCVAVAIHEGLRDQIEQIARRFRVRLLGLRPWWAAALNSTAISPKNDYPMLAVEDSDSLTVLIWVDDVVTSATAYVPVPSPGAVDALLARRAASAQLPTDRLLKIKVNASADQPSGSAVARECQAPFAA